MKTAILIFAILSTLSVAQLITTNIAASASVNIVTSNVYFCDNQACLYPSASANGSLQANTTFYMKLNVTNPLYALLYVRQSSVSFNTSASSSLVSTSVGFNLSVNIPGQFIFNVTYPNISTNVVINVQGSLLASRMLQGSASSSNGVNGNSNSAVFVAAGSSSSTKSSTGSNGQMIIASFLLAAILLV